jgi:hypothetical protein
VRASAESVASVSAAVHRVQSDATDAPVEVATVDRQLAVVPVTLGQDMEAILDQVAVVVPAILDQVAAAVLAILDQVAAAVHRARLDASADRVAGRVILDRA